MNRVFLTLATAVLATVSLCGCGNGGTINPAVSSSTSPQSQSIAQYPIRWLPTDELDLNSRDGTFVRALSESFYQARIVGLTKTAPGYLSAIRDVITYDYDPTLGELTPPHTAYFFVARFPFNDFTTTPSGDLGYAAVCIIVPAIPDWTGPLLFVRYRRTGTAPKPSLRGHLTQPTTNVFGDWKGDDNVIPGVHNRKRCDNPPTTKPLTTELLPPSPGWPNSAA